MQAEFAADPSFVYSERITTQQSVALLKVPTNLFVFIQGLFGCLPWGVLLTYLTDYLAQNKGLSVPTATLVSSLLQHAIIIHKFVYHAAAQLHGQTFALYNTRSINSYMRWTC